MVSHCDTQSRREDFIAELKEHIPVVTYGYCGDLYCPWTEDYAGISHPVCYKVIERKYKFYLSFENAFCTDYGNHFGQLI